ncbi:TPA: fimbrial assembly protein [Burkholderia aenigmatica]|uniref:CS1 type fimbrial major subunit n=1 Tax=Burkholderia sp. AU45251 TaxID=3059204 RepID=UPI002658EBFF|nr:CS1 type fimbrial major subunit [Burkholderia sp. AU45251]HDR9482185.1 fimbrial assembly protein [Burkholderia aenigmatica]HDR9515652.1 fimbrial assembly protein [Burkholderia aenigmatica]HDR9590556.1 fimbrial assembly protein [Burkholderia aenigmatica]HDR9598929.1 fimbrial assembly protein [Burkholderia aenigmatica]HDR9607041.1 fimbrial assembly protein [Burkholderia aenigmatica]
MNATKIVLALCMGATLVGAAHADPVSKTITLTAQINDAIFVSKPDGSTWYSTEELNADDYHQNHFSKTLQVRVYSTKADFNVSLAQPLQMTSGKHMMLNPSVVLGDKDFSKGTAKVTQTTPGADAGTFDQTYDLKIGVDSPTVPAGESRNGSYSGDLVMLFEPTP